MPKLLVLALVAGLAALPAAPVLAAPMSALEQYERMCANVLNFTPRIVRKEAVAAIGSDKRIVVHSICRGVDLTESGNAAGLRRTIAANPVLRAALSRSGWRADDVVAIDPTGASVQLYVHRN